jgi:ribonuclease HII
MDEAGRGPVLGSLVIAAVVMPANELHHLEEHGVDDSKKLTPHRRAELAEVVRSLATEIQVVEIIASEIVSLMASKTLNEIEVLNFQRCYNRLRHPVHTLYLDAADVNEVRFGENVGAGLRAKPEVVVSKHKGDALFRVVGAASIIAKTVRDQRIEEYKQLYGEIGSGYPSDPTTRAFLAQFAKAGEPYPPIVRTTWSTVKKVEAEIRKTTTRQSRLF